MDTMSGPLSGLTESVSWPLYALFGLTATAPLLVLLYTAAYTQFGSAISLSVTRMLRIGSSWSGRGLSGQVRRTIVVDFWELIFFGKYFQSLVGRRYFFFSDKITIVESLIVRSNHIPNKGEVPLINVIVNISCIGRMSE